MMLASGTTSSYTSSNSVSSVKFIDSKVPPWSTPSAQYGPIRIRICGKPAPTLTTGRQSKHLVLVGEEAVKREKRRLRNREAAKKLKERRQNIEDELSEQIKQLESEHQHLHNHLERLYQVKQSLEEQVNNLLDDPFNDLLSADEDDITLRLTSRSNEFDLFDETVERILNESLDACFNSVTHN